MKSTHRPLSPALMGLTGVIVGLCFVVLAYAFVQDTSPRTLLTRDASTPQMRGDMQRSPSAMAATTTAPTNMASGTMMMVSASTTRLAARLFQEVPFRFIKIIDSPDGLYTYFVATDRAEPNQARTPQVKTMNDELCGSIYSQPTCYLFREGRFNAESDGNPRLVATWQGSGAFNDRTDVRFTNKGTQSYMEFTTVDGDAGCSASANHRINLKTGEHSVAQQETECADASDM
ncbi:hypothetical protein KBD34_04345 [Patescibacteria group bacterium]|nr:hypothetical protein [Patescibacteria group bacterium]